MLHLLCLVLQGQITDLRLWNNGCVKHSTLESQQIPDIHRLLEWYLIHLQCTAQNHTVLRNRSISTHISSTLPSNIHHDKRWPSSSKHVSRGKCKLIRPSGNKFGSKWWSEEVLSLTKSKVKTWPKTSKVFKWLRIQDTEETMSSLNALLGYARVLTS